MSKQDYINIIQDLFPADSEFPNSAAEGQKLLLQAIYNKWRELPEAILAEYSRLCVQEEWRQR